MTAKPSIYVITNLAVNHNPESVYPDRRHPIDARLKNGDGRYIYYLTDASTHIKSPIEPVIYETNLDPLLNQAGKKHLAEWSFLLAEEKHSFCTYPLFMISSRFYMKNHWLKNDLNAEWDRLFSYLNEYSYGFLPSYDRPMRWVKLSSLIDNPKVFFPYTPELLDLIRNIYGIHIPGEYAKIPDLGCHYLGFKTRAHLLQYLQFYKPLIHYFLDDQFNLKTDLSQYIRRAGNFPNEKPLTFALELMSHFYFFKNNIPFFCLHYDGYYKIENKQFKFKRLQKTPLPFLIKVKRKIKWLLWWTRTEGHPILLWSLLKKKMAFTLRKIKV